MRDNGRRDPDPEAAMPTQSEKATAFRALHQRAGAFVIPNPWDAGTARLLAHLGFEALATTSAGFAFSRGRPDGGVTREDTIEDSTGRKDDPIYPHDRAVERVRAAVAAARSLPFPFTLTARSENFLWGRPDLADTIRRLQAFQEAGADVLYAPGLKTREEITTLVRAVDRPVNVLAGIPGTPDVAALTAIGVKRISVGGALARAAFGAFMTAAKEMRESGSFTFTDAAMPMRELNAIFAGWQTS